MKIEFSEISTRLTGFDTFGEVFIYKDKILRGIYPGKGESIKNILNICQSNQLFDFGIVKTKILTANKEQNLPYEIILEHNRIPFISYPHEWSISMLKLATIFHIELYEKLGIYNLTIKDWHPYNILFDFTKPIFVDFLSIISLEELSKQDYLNPPKSPVLFKKLWDKQSIYLYEMYRKMYLPYMLLPLYMMRDGQYNKTRLRMQQTILNTSESTINIHETFDGRFLERLQYTIKKNIQKICLLEKSKIKKNFFNSLKREISTFESIDSSSYSNYYQTKNENFNFEPSNLWNNKQKIVHQSIISFHPTTLLDIGSNTGWFSLLAAKLKCKVVATDIDEACVNLLYEKAKKEDLPILPLVMDITQTTPDLFAIKYENEPSLSLIGDNYPVVLSAEKRLKCDMVLALAIIHHLALGRGLNFEEIIAKLNNFTQKYLLLEFVDLNDKLILAEPSFFRSFWQNSDLFDWYNIDNLINVLNKYFKKIEIKPSDSDSRTILVCTK